VTPSERAKSLLAELHLSFSDPELYRDEIEKTITVAIQQAVEEEREAIAAEFARRYQETRAQYKSVYEGYYEGKADAYDLAEFYVRSRSVDKE
jgi:hypothetical protein